jgi:hypothetical protein
MYVSLRQTVLKRLQFGLLEQFSKRKGGGGAVRVGLPCERQKTGEGIRDLEKYCVIGTIRITALDGTIKENVKFTL